MRLRQRWRQFVMAGGLGKRVATRLASKPEQARSRAVAARLRQEFISPPVRARVLDGPVIWTRTRESERRAAGLRKAGYDGPLNADGCIPLANRDAGRALQRMQRTRTQDAPSRRSRERSR